MSLSLPLQGSNTRCHYSGLLWFEIWGSNPGPAARKAIAPRPTKQALAPKLITKHDDFNTYSFTKRLHSCICDTCIYKLDTGKQLPQMARLIEKEKWLLGVTTTTTAQANPETLSKETCKGLINLFL